MVGPESSALKFGFFESSAQTILRHRSLTYQEKRFEFQQQLDSYVNEVVRDEPVSILFHYWPGGNNRLYNQPNSKENNLASAMFNPQERDGAYIEGFKKVEEYLVSGPEKTVLWYSPSGRTEFKNDPGNPFSGIDYDYGQLYVYHRRRSRVDGVALKTSKDAEDFLYKKFFPENAGLPPREKIRQTILTPLIADFDTIGFPENQPFYIDHHNHEYFLPEVKEEIRQRFGGERKKYVEVYDKTIDELARHEIVSEIVWQAFMDYSYKKTIYNHLVLNNKTKQILAGCTGKSEVSLSDLPFAPDSFLPQEFNPSSTVSRLVTQGIKEIMKQEHRHSDYKCPSCGSMRKGEVVGSDRSAWSPCRNCGHLYVC